ncbi:hypothetical protein D3C76_783020 [compost metagenome]
MLDQCGQPLVDHRIQLLRRPAQEQFGLQVGVQRVHILAQQFAAHARTAEEEAGQQRRQGEDVQHVVAVIGHQYRVAFIQVQDAAQGVLLLGHQVHPAHVLDQRLAVAVGQGGVRRVGHLAQQGQVQVEHAGQGAFVQGQAAGGQQRQGHQVDRVDRGRLVEVAGHGFTQAGGGGVEPGRAVLRAVVLFTPAGLLLVEEAGQADRLAEVHVYLAKALLERAEHLEDIEDRLFLLAGTAQLAQVGAAFEHALVADVHRHEDDRRARRAQEAAQGDRQHAGARLQHAPGARTAAFDEVLHREALAEQRVQVLVEHSGIKRVALEGTAHEKGPATAQQATDHRHVEVDAGRHVRWGEAVAEQQVGQQQVVDVAAVARHIDHFMTGGDALHLLDVVDLDAVVDLVPEPAQYHFKEADRGVGVVRGDLVAIAQCLGFGLGQRDALTLGLIADGLAHLRGMDQAFDQVASVRDVRADDCRLEVAKVHAHQALGHAHGALVALVVLHQFTQVDRCRELHTRLAPQDQHGQQPAQAPGDRPAVGEQQLPWAGLTGGGLAPEHAHRDDLRVFLGMLAYRCDQAFEGGRGAALVLAAQPVGVGCQVEERRRLLQCAHGHR